MTQFKDKQAKIGSTDSRVSMGLLNYPVLMAADILLYGTSYVPVGDDQKQHLEYTRDIAIRLNSLFGELFVIPKSVEDQNKFFETDQGLRIKSLSEPNKKMSKSDDSDKGTIFLSDDPELAAKKIMSAETDSLGIINYDPANQPGISNLLQILALFSSRPISEVIDEWTAKTSYGELKKAVADQANNFLRNFQVKLSEVNEEHLIQRLAEGEKSMNDLANKTLFKVQAAVGLRGNPQR
jgi:tryptophanyl-tRNA synthetase